MCIRDRAQGGRVVSCAAVNPMDFRLEGRRRRYIQIGTVMTDPGFKDKENVVEAVRTYIGFKNIRIDGNVFLFNGKPVKLLSLIHIFLLL